MEETKKQTAKQRYYQKNKELYKERVRQQREEKKANPPPPVQNTAIMKEINDSPIQNITNTKRIIIRIPYPALDFLIWTKRMAYVTVDIRDTTGEFMWDGTSHKIKEKNISMQNKYKSEHTVKINTYINGIKRFLKIGERYAMEIPLAKLNIPIFFYIKQINEESIIIDYVKIDFLKIGTGEATIAPLWDEIKQERVMNHTFTKTTDGSVEVRCTVCGKEKVIKR